MQGPICYLFSMFDFHTTIYLNIYLGHSSTSAFFLKEKNYISKWLVMFGEYDHWEKIDQARLPVNRFN